MSRLRLNRFVLAFALQWLAVVSLTAQDLQPENAQNESIHGTVINSVTHEPIGRALVSSPDGRFATLTDSEGHFEFLSSAMCRSGNVGKPVCPTVLQVRKPGFIEEHAHWGTVIPRQDLVLSLQPEALIVGHVLLPSTEAPDQIQVELYQRQVRDGRAHWRMVTGTTTRSNGEFRFSELGAGSYKLFTSELLDRDPLSFSRGAQLFGYPPVYFPSTNDFGSADVIHVSAGQTFQAEMTIAKRPYYSIKIPVINAPTGTGLNVKVSVQGHEGPGFSLGYNFQNASVEGLLPDGTYTVEASTYGTAAVTGLLTFTVKGGPVMGVRMALTHDISIPVNVREEFTSPNELNSNSSTYQPFVHNREAQRGPGRYLNVQLESADEFGLNSFGGFVHSPAGSNDESLRIDNVKPGRYWVRVNSLRGYAASITSGGVDLRYEPLVVPAGGSVDPIEITMRDDWAEIECTVEGLTGNNNLVQVPGPQYSSAHVYLVPQPDSPGEFRDLWIPPDGELGTTRVPPGSYRVLAFDKQRSNLEYDDPDAMRVYDGKGQALQLQAGQKEHLRVQVISANE
jgi:hypothetical protein